MKLNKGGLIACGLYTVFFAALNAIAYSFGDFIIARSSDDVFLAGELEQVSIAPVGITLFLLLERWGISYDGLYGTWWTSLSVLYLLNLAGAYLFGWTLSAITRLVVGPDGGRLYRLDKRLLGWIEKKPKKEQIDVSKRFGGRT